MSPGAGKNSTSASVCRGKMMASGSQIGDSRRESRSIPLDASKEVLDLFPHFFRLNLLWVLSMQSSNATKHRRRFQRQTRLGTAQGKHEDALRINPIDGWNKRMAPMRSDMAIGCSKVARDSVWTATERSRLCLSYAEAWRVRVSESQRPIGCDTGSVSSPEHQVAEPMPARLGWVTTSR